MSYLIEHDGIDHINIYSKGKTDLGRFLSNFSISPIVTVDGEFKTIEGYWYWLSCNDNRLRNTNGFDSKKIGRELGAKDWLENSEFKERIKRAITIKILSSRYYDEFKHSHLPFTHYYVYGDKIVNVPLGDWIIRHIENVRRFS